MKKYIKNSHPRFPTIGPQVFSRWKFLISFLLIVFGVFFLFLSIFAPQNNTDRGDGIIFVLDSSLSMSVEDIPFSGAIMKSRLDLGKSLIEGILEKNSSSYIGLITYARSASMRMPLIHDKSLFLDTLSSVEPTLVYGGSDTRAAFDLIRMTYLGSKEPLHIVLITDGGMTEDGVFPELPSNMALTIIGVGTPIGGMIPLGYNLEGERRYKYYEGSPVVVRYEEANMEKLKKMYNAPLFHRENFNEGVTLATLSYKPEVLYILRIFAAFLILLGYIIRPYAEKK